MKYCSHCGAELADAAVVCPKCGCAVHSGYGISQGEKSWLITLLLCFFVGVFGIHRFYVGKIGTGVVQLLTFGCLGIWTLIDFIMILVGSFKDADGNIIRS